MTQHTINPGDVLLDKYRVERVLGQGGMGFVVAVRHTELDELFAIKLMLPGSMEDEDAERRFLREARAAVRLKGEHVVRVHDVGRLEDGSLYMVMEHLTGYDLKAHLTEKGPLPIEDAISYVLQTCEGIAEAHDRGIIHRDIKPANLFLTERRNGAACVKILDFGISKHTSNDKSGDITKTGSMLGSPLYMSPEQMAHARDVDERTDIWSLGIVFYELLTGTTPFDGQTFTQVVHRVINTPPAPPRELRPDIPPAIESIIFRCLEKAPEKRFETVDALIAALKQALSAPASTRSLALADTLETASDPSASSSRSASGRASSASGSSASEATSGLSTTGMSASGDKIDRSRNSSSGARGALVFGAVGVAVATVMAFFLLSKGGEAPISSPGSASITTPTAPIATEANAPDPSPSSAPAAHPSSEISPSMSADIAAAGASAISSASPTTKAGRNAGTVRLAKPAEEGPVPTSETAPAPAPSPTPQGSTKPRTHSMY